MSLPILISIPISHYCERARWALDYCGVPYVEEHHLQILHARRLRRIAGVGRTTPALDLGPSQGGLGDSHAIVRYADALAKAERKLYPEGAMRAEIESFEQEIAGEYGVETRRAAYPVFFRMGYAGLPYNDGRAPLWQRAAIRATFPLAKRVLTKYLHINEDTVRRARSRIEATLARVDERLSDGRPYLFGDRLTAADITFASMSAPEVLPVEYGGRAGVSLPKLDALPDDVASRVAQTRLRPAGQYVLRIYRTERLTPR